MDFSASDEGKQENDETDIALNAEQPPSKGKLFKQGQYMNPFSASLPTVFLHLLY